MNQRKKSLRSFPLSLIGKGCYNIRVTRTIRGGIMLIMDNLKKTLREEGLIDAEQWEKCVLLQKQTGGRIDRILVDEGAVPEVLMAKITASLLGVPYVDTIPPGAADSSLPLPEDFLRNNGCVPVKLNGGETLLALRDPLNLEILNEINCLLKLNMKAVAAPAEEIARAGEEFSRAREEAAENTLGELDSSGITVASSMSEEPEDLLDLANKAPVIKLVNLILFQALKQGASDIHIQPFEKELKVRYRIDGILHDVLTPPKRYDAAVTSRIKIMSNLNIAERRLPQDGRAAIKFENRPIDLRVSIIPTAFGERVVLRLLDKETLSMGLEELGFSRKNFLAANRLIKIPHGIILSTGPTGGGKTTTLYAALSRINSPDKNIITIEDPIEYQLPGISQIQVKPQIGLTFASGLRHIVRQDPDVIMVGEIRDRETAEIAVHASLTGHLVFSTLHTNDSCGAVTRLLDMGIEPYLVSSSLAAVIAQRLVRTICSSCREEYSPGKEALEEIGISGDEAKVIMRGKGCGECLQTGYRGRTGIYEIAVIDDELRELVLKRSDTGTIKKKAVEKGMASLMQDGAAKVLEGATTIEEVLRVTRES